MIAYVSRLNLPDPAANSLQTIRMAAALAQLAEPTGLFVHDLSTPEAEIRRAYGIEGSRLRFWPLRTDRWPAALYNRGTLRFTAYNSGVAAILGLHPAWRGLPRAGNVLFVRSRLEILYWGLMRPYLPWLRGWLFACELHDLPGSGEEPDAAPRHARRRGRMARALGGYDLVITVNQALAEDLADLTGGAVRGEVLPLCSGLERLAAPPEAALPQGRVVIGYFGTIDRNHGVETALQALDRLPERFVLRLTGRVRADVRDLVEAASRTGRVEVRGPVPYAQMAAEIDACHLALVPAGDTLHAIRYRSPLKIFDAMLRGKPILAADVPCHRELLAEGQTALFYRNGDPADLAARAQALAADPRQMEALARRAWKASAGYTYPARARALLALVEAAGERRVSRKTAHERPREADSVRQPHR